MASIPKSQPEAGLSVTCGRSTCHCATSPRRDVALVPQGSSPRGGRADCGTEKLPLPVSPRTLHRLSLIIFGLRPSNSPYLFCPLYSPPVCWCNKFNSNVINCRHRRGGPTGASVFHIFIALLVPSHSACRRQEIKDITFRDSNSSGRGRKET